MRGLGLMVTPVMAGVRTDVEAFLERFRSEADGSFGAFRHVFVDMRLGTLFCGRESEAELRELIQKVLSLCLGYAVAEEDLVTGAGALYLLYAFYFLQPRSTKLHIPITTAKMLKLNHVLEGLRAAGFTEVLFITLKLFREQAFALTAWDEEMNPLTHKTYDNRADDLTSDQLFNQLSSRVDKESIRRLASHPDLALLTQTHAEYIAVKARLPPASLASLGLVRDDLSVYLDSVADETEAKISRRGAIAAKRQAPDADEDGGLSPVKQRRVALKEKAYGGVIRQAKHRRHRQETGKLIRAAAIDFEHQPVVDVLAQAFPPLSELAAAREGEPPKKKHKKKDGQATATTSGDGTEASPKRKVGRPKGSPSKPRAKQPKEDGAAEDPSAKKSSGRPTKVAAPPKNPKAKKARGRPRLCMAGELEEVTR